MDNKRDTHCFEGGTRELGSLRGGGGGKLTAPHVREVDAGLLENRAVAQHAGLTPATLGAAPRVATKAPCTIRGFDCRGQLIVQAAQVPRDVVYR